MTYNPFRTALSLVTHPGAKGRAVSTLVRYGKWQLASRLLGQTYVMPWIDDARLYVSRGEAMVTHNLYTGLYEFADMLFFLRYLTTDDKFLDVGANAGVYSVLAGRVAKSEVLSFEPVPDTFRRLSENLRLNGLDATARTVNKGLADRAGTLRFTTQRDATNHVCAPGEHVEGTMDVPVATLDDELARMQYTPTVMKIDVEGYERPVLQGAERLLASESLEVILIEMNDSGARYGWSDEEVSMLIRRQGFCACEYLVNENIVRPVSGYRSTQQNTLFIRHPDGVNQRLRDPKEHYLHPTKTRV